MTVSDSTETHAKCIWHDKEGVCTRSHSPLIYWK
ncbi:hypothetical protein QW44_08395 [Salmonella enterica]|uniref:Uncharacterized protein n=1 Tax=Salmonella enterica TaxID=28901 RepID=A0A8E7NK97_SALER|nr:hypothetical protein QW44_08395 [Salmonella enterica]